jgi:hypothetical protein
MPEWGRETTTDGAVKKQPESKSLAQRSLEVNSAEASSAVDAPPDPKKLRRCGRMRKEIPILLFGSDLDGSVFTEDTKTVVLSLHGAGIVSKYRLLPEQELVVAMKRGGARGGTGSIDLEIDRGFEMGAGNRPSPAAEGEQPLPGVAAENPVLVPVAEIAAPEGRRKFSGGDCEVH